MNRSTTSAGQKPLLVLKALSDPRVSTLSDVAAVTQLDRASALRTLQVLVQEGFVRRNPKTKRYSYGEECYIMMSALKARQDVRTAARSSLLRLAAWSGDQASLVVRRGFESVFIDREVGNFPMQLSQQSIGSRRPLGYGAGSLALLLADSRQDLDEILARIEPMLRRYAPFSVAHIRSEWEEARERGYVRIYDLVVPDVGAISRPVRSIDGSVVGAVTVSGLTKRIRAREKAIAVHIETEVMGIEAGLAKLG
jgi:DNA-binding IclR family transcriptional regulator